MNGEGSLRDGACSLLAHDEEYMRCTLLVHSPSLEHLSPLKDEKEDSYPLQPLLIPDIKGYFTSKTHKHLTSLRNTNPSSKMLKIYLYSFCIAWSQKADLKAFKILFKLQFNSGSLLLPPREKTNNIALEGLRLQESPPFNTALIKPILNIHCSTSQSLARSLLLPYPLTDMFTQVSTTGKIHFH